MSPNQEELDSCVFSLKNLAIFSEKLLDYIAHKKFLSKEAHLNFKQSFARTQLAARRLGKILGGFSDPSFKKMFLRVLTEGNWDKAQAYAKRHFSPEGAFLLSYLQVF